MVIWLKYPESNRKETRTNLTYSIESRLHLIYYYYSVLITRKHRKHVQVRVQLNWELAPE
jgi:hypothetical protein